MKPTALIYDTLDDRREIWSLLHRLHPLRRVRFLRLCCQQVTLPGGSQSPAPSYRMHERIRAALRDDTADEWLTNEIYGDLFQLAHQWRLDLDTVTRRLEEVVKGKDSLPLPCFELSIPSTMLK